MRCLIASLLLCASVTMTFAQDTSPLNGSETVGARPTALPTGPSETEPGTDLSDPSFDRYANVSQILQAINSADAAALADSGLQLAEGERILGRSHKRPEILAERILLLAFEAAREAKDQATLARLKKASTIMNSPALTSAISTSEKLGGESRTTLTVPSISLTLPAHQVHLITEYLQAIRRAKLLKDLQSLNSIEHQLKSQTELPGEHHQYLLAMAADSRSSLEKGASHEPDPLTLLADSSRGFGFPSFPHNFPHIPNLPNPGPVYVTCPCCKGSGRIGAHERSHYDSILQGGSRSIENSGLETTQPEDNPQSTSENDPNPLTGGSRGWFEKATGVRTPDVIRNIAPNGLSYTPPPESVSTFGDPVSYPPVYLRIRLVNTSNWTIAYRLNGQGKPRLGPYATAEWTFQGNTQNPPRCNIQFDDGPSSKGYSLREGTHRFGIRGNTLDLSYDGN